METIPIYDATVPIACTAPSDEIPQRLEVIERLRLNLERIERTEHGMLLHLPNRPDVVVDVQKFTVDEKRCCAFWGFDINTTTEGLALRWDAPPALDHYIATLIAYFEGDQPITEVSGLL